MKYTWPEETQAFFMEKDKWNKYYKLTNGRNPRKLLISALPYIAKRGKALDLGAGDLTDSLFLVSQGFSVIAVDNSPSSLVLSKKIERPGLIFEPISFESYNFQPDTFNLISAQFALPFISADAFSKIFQEIKKALRKEGLFVGNLFGLQDEWNTGTTTDMNFHAKEEIERLLSDMEIIQLTETQEDKETAAGVLKHWHVFDIIAKK